MLMLIPKFVTRVEKGLLDPNSVPETQIDEPKSPKISCMGRIKHKDKQRKNKKLIKSPKLPKTSPLRAFFSRPQEKLSGAPRPHPKVPKSPHMRRFASGSHAKVAGFDWRMQGSSVGAKHRNVYNLNEDSEDENEILIPFSAPLIMGSGEINNNNIIELKPRNEINLWKRRTMAQPRPLQVATFR